jgi:hypothetical protein
MAMLAFGCQPIVEEPDAGPPVNHPPRIDDRFSTPQASLIDVDAATDGCTSSTPLAFSLGEVIDEDIDQTVQERWLIDYDLHKDDATPDLGTTITLQPIQNSPSIRTDPTNAFPLSNKNLKLDDDGTGTPHVIDVFVSDGFDNNGPSDGGPVRPTDVLPNRALVHKAWVIWFRTPGECAGASNPP